MPVVALSNLKGGVGKTSTTYHVGSMLARGGTRVLLVDADPQASLTQGFWGPTHTRDLDPARTIAALYDPDSGLPVPESLVDPTGLENLYLLPGSRHLTRANMREPETWHGLELGLRDALAELPGYDLVLVDCPPNIHLLTWSALVAATHVVVPLQPEDFGAQGLAPILEAIRAVQEAANPALQLAGLLLTMVDKRLGIHQTYEAQLRELYRHAVFQAVVPRAKDFVEAVATRQPIAGYKPKSAAAKAAATVGAELLERCVPATADADDRRVA